MTSRSSKGLLLLTILFLLFSVVLASCGNTGDTTPPEESGGEVTTVTGTATGGTTTAPQGDTTPAVTDKPKDPDTPTVTTKPKDPEKPADTTKPNDTEAEPTLKDPSLFEGVMIHSVYGTGKKAAEAVIPFGYIQLYNESDKDIALAGASLYYKTDNGEPYSEFTFSKDAVIPKGGYYLVRCAGPSDFIPENAILSVDHTDADWGQVIDNKEVTLLLAPSGKKLDAAAPLDTLTGINSYFFASDSYSNLHYAVNDLSRRKVAVRTALKNDSGYHLVNLTKALASDLEKLVTRTSDGRVNAVVGGMLNEVSFSHTAGIYDKPFLLSLSAKEGWLIYYTVDGSDPSDLSNPARLEYRGALSLSGTASLPWGSLTSEWARWNGASRPTVQNLPGSYVIKAYATNALKDTPVYTNTYFIASGIESYGVPVFSFSIPDSEIIGSNGFYSNFMPTGNITATRPRGLGVLEVFDEKGGRVGVSNVEMAVSGNGSSGFAMKSLRIYYKGALNEVGGMHSDLDYDLFDGLAKDSEGNPITTFDRLLLRNSGNDCGTSYIRDAYMQRVSEGLAVDTMASRSVLLFINGEFWGVYNARERYSPEYVESHYGVDKETVAVIENDYSQVHTNTNAPYVVQSGEEGDANSFNALVTYLRQSDMANDYAYDYVKERMDIESFIDMWVVRLYFNAVDWPENNVKVFRNKNPDDPSGFDTKWHFTLLDLDMGLSFYGHTGETSNIFGAFNRGSVCGNMMCDLIENEEFKKQFILRYYEVVTEHFTPERLSAVFEALYDERIALMSLQQARWGNEGASTSRFMSTSNDIRRFIQNRNSYALNALYRHFGIDESYIDSISNYRVTLRFNENRATVSVNGESVKPNTLFKFELDSTTLSIVASAKEGYTVTSITFTDSQGNRQYAEGSEAIFSITASGSITVATKKLDTGEPPTGGTLVAGPTYLFYLTDAGELYAWGDNRSGVLGLGYEGGTVTTPTFIMDNVAKVSTTAAAAYQNNDTVFMTAILTKDGKLYTVGNNTCGQLGRNGSHDSYELRQVSFSGKITDVSVGYDHMLIIDENGTLWGVGSNSYGQLGAAGEGGNVFSFQRIAEGVTSVAGGRRSSAFIGEDGILYGLGDNRWKKLSQSVGDRTNTPCVMIENVLYVSSGEHQVLVVTEDGSLYYAGRRDYNSYQLGNGNNPTMVQVAEGVVKAASYFDNMVILTEDGEALVYGLNTENAIGKAVVGRAPEKLLDGIVDIASGYGFSAFLTEEGTVIIQGDNSFGQAGIGETSDSVTFSEISI